MLSNKVNGKIVTIPIEKLCVDGRYQRALRVAFIDSQSTDEEFMPILIGIPEVSKRTDGSYFVLDGQHRIEILKRRGYDSVRCHVHEGLAPNEEAFFYRYYNKKRLQIGAFDDYRAAIFEGEPKHLQIQEAVEKRGLTVAAYSSPKTISAIWQLRKMVGYGTTAAAGSKERLERVLDLTLNTWAGEPNLLEGEVLDALFYMVRRFPQMDDARAVKRWSAKWTPKRLLSAGHDAKYTYGISKVRGMVEQLITTYDRGLRNESKLRPVDELVEA